MTLEEAEKVAWFISKYPPNPVRLYSAACFANIVFPEYKWIYDTRVLEVEGVRMEDKYIRVEKKAKVNDK